MYNKILEKCVCKFFSEIAIRKNISVGIAQIKISTAKEILRENPDDFIKKICDDNLNIEICAKLLKTIIDKYEDMCTSNAYDYEDYEDVYDYIACEYMGAYAWQKDKTALIYSSVLRSFMKEERLYYTGDKHTGRCLVCLSKDNTRRIHYDKFQEFVKEFGDDIIIHKKVYVKGQEFAFEFVCDNEEYIRIASDFAKENECEFKVSER